MPLSSQLLEEGVQAFSKLPGIGRKTALRLALHLLQAEEEEVVDFAKALLDMKQKIQFCQKCHNISDQETCSICLSPSRSKQIICVVESIKEVMAIENTQQFQGTYHVLGGLIAPIDGIGPSELEIASLIERIEKDEVEELIMALSPSIEGDTTVYYISKQLAGKTIKISTIARGVSFGGELEYADELTLGRSILGRLPYKQS
ncbi:recombination protein RecR [Saprospira grandis DSM 2844]|uniref:Recombination protein RecR n=1 Tax=Saprospira grandis DSM 2844 TaxID=694433 RepID=J0NXP7_9BACT|nr:recombination mediator RecR [Saprospira grandis]EJF52279.1 recombination protein RecR [Saprospira grandis DSM 2844]